jgi:uncharacterized caspase-like protein
MNEDYALIVGVEHYQSKSLSQLPGAINDAKDFYDWVTSDEGGKVDSDNCTLLTSKEELSAVMIAQIENEINNKCNEARDNKNGGRFYFFFSGHGLGVNARETALIPTDWVDGLPRAMATDVWKQSILERGAFREVLFFLDCCRGRKVNLLPSSNGLYNAKAAEDIEDLKDFVAQATSYLDVAYEAENGTRKNGFFTTALLRGLKGDAADEKGVITFEGLKNYLESETSVVAQQFNKRQKARVNYSHSADAVFVKVGKHKDENVTILLTRPENGPFKIEDHSFKKVADYDGADEQWNLSLPNGLYTIIDAKGNEKNIRIKIDSNTNFDVKF